MQEELNPLEYLIKIQRIKLRFLALPIFIVICGLGLNLLLKIDFFKYLSLLGLILYFILQILYHIHRIYQFDEDTGAFIAPVSGIVIGIEDQEVLIKKRWFQPADLRAPCIYETAPFEITLGKIYLFQTESHLAGKLIGLVPGSIICRCLIPSDYVIIVKPSEKVRSGETILASIQEQKKGGR